MPKVSVIILVYKVEDYIEMCARSLFEQTLDDIEYIFVDDCSPDNSINILESVIEEYPERKKQCKIIQRKKNGGQHIARESGIQEVTGEYTIHCDADDYVDCFMYEKLYTQAKEGALDYVWCNYKVLTDTISERKQSVKSSQQDLVRALLRGNMMGCLWNKLIKTSIIKKTGIIYPKSPLLEDLLLVVQYTLLANSFGYIDESLYIYRRREGSITSSKNVSFALRKKRIEMIKMNVCAIDNVLQAHGRYSEFEEDVIYAKYWKKFAVFSKQPNVIECNCWIGLYSEINCKLFFCKSLSFVNKIIALLIYLRLYTLFIR